MATRPDNIERNKAQFTQHGMSHTTAEWRAWRNMKRRCDSPCRADYHRYGGRGISVHPAWQESFLQFLADVGPRPSPAHTLDRLNNEGDYEPGNVAWRTRKEQAQNRCTNRHLVLDGVSHTTAEWADRLGMKADTLYCRLNRLGWSVERTLTTPVRAGVGRRLDLEQQPGAD